MAWVTGTEQPTDRPRKAGWRLSLLGAWQLTGAGGAVAVGTNAQRLFALLALRGACVRSYLAGLLWPDCSDPHAHDNLRATLSRLHQRNLTRVLQSANGVLSLHADVQVDVRTLVSTASSVLDGTGRQVDRAATQVLGGNDLLLGWYDDWVLLDRERVRQLRLHALEALSTQLLAAGNAPAAVEAALAAVAVEPLRESAHRAVIRGHLAEGNRAEALRQFDRLRQLLRTELGVEPAPLAAELFR
jgi:DNA-binding SARP family transcriptional activator